MTTSEREDTPYIDETERLLDELVRIDLLLRKHLEAWLAERDWDVDEFRGLYVSDEEVDRLLATGHYSDRVKMPHDAGKTAPAGRYDDEGSTLEDALERVTDRIDARASRTAETEGPCRLGTLTRRFGLDRRELDALLLALAPDLDEKYEKIYGYLQDDVTRIRPRAGLVLRVLAADHHERLAARQLFEPGSTLVDEGLVAVADDGSPFESRHVRIPGRVASYLVGGNALHGQLADDAEIVDPRAPLSSISLDDECRERMERVLERLTGGEDPLVAAFLGPDETTAEYAVKAVCTEADRSLIQVEGSVLAGDDHTEVIAQLRREVQLRNAALHVRKMGELSTDHTQAATEDGAGEDRTLDEASIDTLIVALDRIPGDVFVTGETEVTERLNPRLSAHVVATVRFPRPSRARRVELWSAVPNLPDDVDPASLADTYRLTRGQIEDAISTARAIADGTLTREAIWEGCRAHARFRLDELAREVEPGYDWDDIVLPSDTRAHLEEVAAHVRNRGTVFEDWGFEDRFNRGNGINVLFSGSSGTGKTMASEVIAHDAGLPLYVLDLSAVTSKYIGETEKNLRRVFDEAENINAILFFDEADALFGKRTEVSDAHDRYANVEVDYLLQRMETHDGNVILASNLEANIDDAFLRRINLSVDFPFPDRGARAKIWRRIFPTETPCREIDVAFLAEFELAGGNIRNVATTAAFMAAEEDTVVEMAHIVRALRRELQKTDRLFERSDFGEYSDHLPRYD